LVGQRLGVATAAMAVLPILSFFVTRHFCQAKEAPDTWAGGAAILVTNIIVAGYCIAAFSEKDDQAEKNKDADAPRVGIYKQRTD
jgi:VMA21-like domain